MCFFNFDFFNFFFDFSWFWLDFGRPRALQKLKKNRKNRFFLAFRFEGGFWKGSGRVWGGFKEGFGRILERFCSWVPHRIWRDMCEAFQVEDLALMIRATRGRSIDWSLGWSIILSIERSINQSIDRLTHRSIDQPIDWSNELSIKRWIERGID